ncbi:hypothetical protein [Pontiella desulfatans]|nr:hypothetical protein [Pontiella desulfatans]
MKTWKKHIGIVLLIVLGCGQAQSKANHPAQRDATHQTQQTGLELSSGALYFSSTITPDEANKL